jgi:glycosyltransferase involved in cell wall biosynthesis
MLSVCIFARNEERLLPQCAGSLDRAGLTADDRVFILVNGSTDETLSVARALAAADPRIAVCDLPVGDKANAWNDYVHRLAPPKATAHVFIDGDIAAGPGALTALNEALAQSPEAYAAAALPAAGRSRRRWARHLLLNRHLSGNLYALSDSAIAAFRQKRLRLPFGAKGEDGLIAYLLLTDLQGGDDDSHDQRIIVAENAVFEFDPLQPNLRDLKIYARRLQRYSERHFQKELLYDRLKEKGVRAMPDAVSEIYTDEACRTLRPRFGPVNFWVDLATLRRLKTGARALAETA